MATISLNPFSTFVAFDHNGCVVNERTKSSASAASLQSISKAKISPIQQRQQQQLKLSVLRFTLGIPGLDESYLPRWIGYGFGFLLLSNHFVGSNSNTSQAQLITEGLGMSLAVFSVALPYIGKFLKGGTLVDPTTHSEGLEQLFVMSKNISDAQKEELAWATYILLRNTNATAVLISVQGALCVRGYWNVPDGVSKSQMLDWFGRQIEKIALSDLKDTLYFPQGATYEFSEIEMLHRVTGSLLVQPVQQAPNTRACEMDNMEGFFLLASSMSYAFGDKDRTWIGGVSNKFRGRKLILSQDTGNNARSIVNGAQWAIPSEFLH